MAELCSCNTQGGNTGLPSCYPIFGVTKQPIFVNYHKDDGTINGIKLSDLTDGKLDSTYLDSKVKALNPKDRWYPTPELKNIVDEREDDRTEDFEDTTSVYIGQGERNFEGMIVKGDPVLMGNLKSWRCKKVGVFYVDNKGNLIGNFTRDGYLDPVLVQDESLSIGFMKGTDTTVQKVRVRFSVSALMDDADLRMIEAVDITANLLGVNGLVTAVASTPTNVSTTGFTAQINTNFGGLTSKIPAEGLDESNFYVYNETQSQEETVTVVESTTVDGEYSFVYGTPVTAGDQLTVSNVQSGNLEVYDLTSFTVNTPT